MCAAERLGQHSSRDERIEPLRGQIERFGRNFLLIGALQRIEAQPSGESLNRCRIASSAAGRRPDSERAAEPPSPMTIDTIGTLSEAISMRLRRSPRSVALLGTDTGIRSRRIDERNQGMPKRSAIFMSRSDLR